MLALFLGAAPTAQADPGWCHGWNGNGCGWGHPHGPWRGGYYGGWYPGQNIQVCATGPWRFVTVCW
jgi:hypothetical protein